MDRPGVAKPEEIPPGASKLVTVDGKEVALFNVEGCLYALGNRCPHRGGPLVRGRLERLPDSGAWAVRCPIHGWLFDLASGKNATGPHAGTPSYPVICRDGEVFVEPPPPG
ncbi:MAG: Rieske 2Fe-2S domain-containing protein [Candidatus Omnitrophica bacterium]|nr:Rieske 2Fe-2S domain-containing protein [Candidatus Omnitrophota bacterium]